MFCKCRFLAITLSAVAMAAQTARADAARSDRARLMEITKVAPPVTPASKVSINPQPLPPLIQREASSFNNLGPGSRVAINPQPLPPKQQLGGHGIR